MSEAKGLSVDNKVAIAILLGNRSFLYAYIWEAFGSIATDGLFSRVNDDSTSEQCALLDETARGAGLTLQQSIRVSLQSHPNPLASFASEYTRLFIGPEKLPAPPWESVYVSGEPLLFQESTLAVREAYLREGFRAAGYPHEADDHVATELNFMAALCKRALDTYESGDTELCRSTLEAQARFLSEHLLVWIREFSDRLGAVRGISAFYPSFAALASLVCERDAEVIQELLAEI